MSQESSWRQSQYDLKHELNDAKDTLLEMERLANRRSSAMEERFYSKASLYQTRLADLESENFKYQLQIRDLQSQVSALQSASSRQRSLEKKLDGQIEETVRRYEVLLNEKEQIITDLKYENKELRDSSDRLRKTLRQTQEDYTEHQTKASYQTKELEELRSKVRELTTTRNTLSSERNSLSKAMQQYQVKIRSLESLKHDSDCQVEQTKRELDRVIAGKEEKIVVVEEEKSQLEHHYQNELFARDQTIAEQSCQLEQLHEMITKLTEQTRLLTEEQREETEAAQREMGNKRSYLTKKKRLLSEIDKDL